VSTTIAAAWTNDESSIDTVTIRKNKNRNQRLTPLIFMAASLIDGTILTTKIILAATGTADDR
jgi:hypothetical protein